jgi:hypothetical protein
MLKGIETYRERVQLKRYETVDPCVVSVREQVDRMSFEHTVDLRENLRVEAPMVWRRKLSAVEIRVHIGFSLNVTTQVKYISLVETS